MLRTVLLALALELAAVGAASGNTTPRMTHRQCAKFYPGNLQEEKDARLKCQDDAADGRLEKATNAGQF